MPLTVDVLAVTVHVEITLHAGVVLHLKYFAKCLKKNSSSFKSMSAKKSVKINELSNHPFKCVC